VVYTMLPTVENSRKREVEEGIWTPIHMKEEKKRAAVKIRKEEREGGKECQ